MPTPNAEPGSDLHHTQIVEAKVRTLDSLAAEENEDNPDFTEWEANFIGDVKDRVDRFHIPLTNEQEAKLNEIWAKMKLLYPDLDYTDYVK